MKLKWSVFFYLSITKKERDTEASHLCSAQIASPFHESGICATQSSGSSYYSGGEGKETHYFLLLSQSY